MIRVNQVSVFKVCSLRARVSFCSLVAMMTALATLLPATVGAAVRVPVRWCILAEMDAPFSEADPGGGPSFEDPSIMVDKNGDPEDSVKGVLWRRGERATDYIFLPKANITFRSGATFQQPSFPVIDDAIRVAGDKPGDMLAICAADGSGSGLCSGVQGDGAAEFEDAMVRCRDAWLANDPASEGIIAVQINEFVDVNGTRVTIGGVGYNGGALGSRTANVDVAYTFPGTGFTWPEIPAQLGVPGDWQEKVFAHELGHTLTLGHLSPLNCDTCDNLMQYELPTDPDPAVSMFGTILTQTQADQVVMFACSNVGGVDNCPDNPPKLKIGSQSDPRGDAVGLPGILFVDILGFGVAEDPFQAATRLVVDLAAVPTIAVLVDFFVDTDDDPSTGGDPTGLFPAFTGPSGIELVARTDLSTLDVDVFQFSDGSFALVEDPGIEVTMAPVMSSADNLIDGSSFSTASGGFITFRIPQGVIEPFGSVVTVMVRSDFLNEAGDVARGTLVLDAPTFPSCTVAPEAAAPGEVVKVNATGMPVDSPVIVYLGDEKVVEGTTDLTGFVSVDFEIPADTGGATHLVTVGIDDKVTAITADCEVEVLGPTLVHRWIFSGVAEGGRISATINGCVVTIATVAGQSAARVARDFATAVNADGCVKQQGVTAEATGSVVTLTGRGLSVTDTTIRDPGIRHQVASHPVQDFPTAVRGGDSRTKILFVQSASPDTETFAAAVFRAQDGDVLETRSIVLTPNSTSSVIFSGEDDLEVGHIETLVSPGVVATEVINLSIPGVGDVPPIGVGPAPACEKPVIALERNLEFDTGVALANTGAKTASCDWSIYSGSEAFLVGMGTTMVPAFGQTQFFPLNDPSIPSVSLPFEGNVQYACNTPVHAFSLFQRKSDGALFSNAAGCVGKPKCFTTQCDCTGASVVLSCGECSLIAQGGGQVSWSSDGTPGKCRQLAGKCGLPQGCPP
jgi:hypothetical protein